MGARTLLTVEEFAQMHTSEIEDYELVEGERIPLSSGTPRDSKIRRNLQRLLEDYFCGNAIGEPFDYENVELFVHTQGDIRLLIGNGVLNHPCCQGPRGRGEILA